MELIPLSIEHRCAGLEDSDFKKVFPFWQIREYGIIKGLVPTAFL